MTPYNPAFVQEDETGPVVPVYLLAKTSSPGHKALDDRAKAWMDAAGFQPESGCFLLVPGEEKALECVILGLGSDEDPFVVGALPQSLPKGAYRLAYDFAKERDRTRDALAWALGAYRFERYKRAKHNGSLLQLDSTIADPKELFAEARAIALGRDLVTTPANDMGPAEIADAAITLAKRHEASWRVIEGENLLQQNFPLVHAVGCASSRPPCLAEFAWGREDHPKITLVGKGVAFDTGGLDVKPASAMALMKKDMGGAASVLALASIVMEMQLPVRLKVIIPAVDNAISGASFRPGDVLMSRSGRTVEIGNTDAEGRLILADALTLACEDQPELIIDMATLTGAARVALGTEIPALFSSDPAFANALQAVSIEIADPLWHMPLWRPYRKQLESKIADINHISNGPYGGAITAALFLSTFVPEDICWAHVDLMAYNTTASPGRPVGGEVQGVRAIYAQLKTLYG